MNDLRTLALEALLRRACGQLGSPRLKRKQLREKTPQFSLSDVPVALFS